MTAEVSAVVTFCRRRTGSRSVIRCQPRPGNPLDGLRWMFRSPSARPCGGRSFACTAPRQVSSVASPDSSN
jgi:hypothetical protein